MSQEARRGRPEARDWLGSADPDQVFLSAVTLGEIMKSILDDEAITDIESGGPVAESP